MTADIHRGSGDAWLDLAAELQQRLRERDPDARVQATVGPSGLLQLDVATLPEQHAAAQALARRYEERARSICECCGGGVGVAGAGPVVTILCTDCSTDVGTASSGGAP
jgi:hypothetical protein